MQCFIFKMRAEVQGGPTRKYINCHSTAWKKPQSGSLTLPLSCVFQIFLCIYCSSAYSDKSGCSTWTDCPAGTITLVTPSNSQKWVAGEIGFDHFVLCRAILIHVSVQVNLCLFLEFKSFYKKFQEKVWTFFDWSAVSWMFWGFFPWQSCTFLQQLLPHSWLL